MNVSLRWAFYEKRLIKPEHDYWFKYNGASLNTDADPYGLAIRWFHSHLITCFLNRLDVYRLPNTSTFDTSNYSFSLSTLLVDILLVDYFNFKFLIQLNTFDCKWIGFSIINILTAAFTVSDKENNANSFIFPVLSVTYFSDKTWHWIISASIIIWLMGYPMYEIIIRRAVLSFRFYFEQPSLVEFFSTQVFVFLVIQNQFRWN